MPYALCQHRDKLNVMNVGTERIKHIYYLKVNIADNLRNFPPVVLSKITPCKYDEDFEKCIDLV